MVNDLIKRCQEEVDIATCRDCGLYKQDKINDLDCLEYLLKMYCKKYDQDCYIVVE